MIDSIGGEILSSYCTCTAWLYGSCNHLIGVLFRVKADVLTGLSEPTYTSICPAWNFPSTKKQIIPNKISKSIFTNETYLKKSNTRFTRIKERRSRKKLS